VHKTYKILRRERRFFLFLLILAPLIEGFLFFGYYQDADMRSRIAALGSLTSCKQELTRCTAAYLFNRHQSAAGKCT
jgi:hypothetical protein